jgi:putative phosphoesterase
MKVALVGEIHANLPALEAVLAHARQQQAQAIWSVGDIVGYGPFPDKVVQQLRREYVLSTIGDYDHQVLRFKKRRAKWRREKRLEEYLSLKWTYEQLSKESKKYLRFLSKEIRMRMQRQRVLLTPGSLNSGKEYLTADTPEARLRKVAQQAKADIIVCGHSHRSFVRRIDGVWFISPGSTGHPVDGDARASYALLQFGPDGLTVQHQRVAYDVEGTVTAIREHKLPEALAQIFLQAHDLVTILEGAHG